MKGADTVSRYAEYLYNFCTVYEAIEPYLESDHEVEALKPFIPHEPYYTAQIKQDLEHLL